MEKKLINLIVLIAVVLLGVGGLFYFLWVWSPAQSTKFDEFAKCITDKGVKFYGAFWCPHCQDQKALFGGSAKYIPYVECSTSDSNGQLQICIDQKIEVYPTWKFADGLKQEGGLTLQELSDKSGCLLP